jgi:putative oxidoreductase
MVSDEGEFLTQTERLFISHAPAATLLIRLLVGGVFLLEGIKKFLFVEQWGAGRFARIGIPAPHVLAPLVGVTEIVCGLLLLLGLLTRLAAVPLIIDISVAIASTKVPLLFKSGFWPMEAEARTDYSMILGLIFLFLVGAGPFSFDAAAKRIWSRRNPPAHHQD